MITIHYDYCDGKEISYIEGLEAFKNRIDFTTNCLDFFSNDVQCNVLVKDKRGNILDKNLLMNQKNSYTMKYMKVEHNLHKMLVSGSFKWQD